MIRSNNKETEEAAAACVPLSKPRPKRKNIKGEHGASLGCNETIGTIKLFLKVSLLPWKGNSPSKLSQVFMQICSVPATAAACRMWGNKFVTVIGIAMSMLSL